LSYEDRLAAGMIKVDYDFDRSGFGRYPEINNDLNDRPSIWIG
jgi:hypothetical protein